MPNYDVWELLQPPGILPDVPIRSELIRSILGRRGIATAEDYRRFVAPALSDLHDAALIHGMDGACERIERAIRAKESILIYGDYDVDGVTSIVLLQTVLRHLGADVGFVVPHRLFDGYGLKTEVLDRVLGEKNVRLVITVDCGITSVAPVERALERGIEVIITDHHLPPEVLPAAAGVLNPKREGCHYPFKDLAGVGVAFKLCCALLKRSGSSMSIESLLKIAAIGTIADVAPLTGENRTIVRLGLEGLKEVRNHGLRALLRMVGLYGKPLSASDIGFRLGPRINAAGRLTSADTAIRLFAAASEGEAYPIVAELDRLNAERREVEAGVLSQAEAAITARSELPRILLLAGEGWHRGVLGLCAGKLAEKYHRPVLLASIDGELCVGSGRSIRTVDLHHCLEQVSELFEHFGGHQFACGFSLRTERLPTLQERLESIGASLEEGVFARKISVDGALPLHGFSADFALEHEALSPFGAANPQPVFLTTGLQVDSLRPFGKASYDLLLTDGLEKRKAVLWGSAAGVRGAVEAGAFDALLELEPDSYAAEGYRLVIRDAAPAGKALIRNESPETPV